MTRSVLFALLIASLVASDASAAEPSGERLAYLVGCINCHHQTPKEILDGPPLAIVQGYSLPEFRKLMKTGVTRTGRDMVALSSIMGVVAVAIHAFRWSRRARAAA